MRFFILCLVIGFSNLAKADENSSFSPNDLCLMLEVKEEIFSLSEDGQKISNRIGNVQRARIAGLGDGKFKGKLPGSACVISRSTGSRSGGMEKPIFFGYQVLVKQDGRIVVDFGEFDKQPDRTKEREEIMAASVKRSEFDVSDLKSVNWLSVLTKQKVLVRLSFDLVGDGGPKAINKVDLGVRDAVIYDNSGNVLVENVSFRSPYIILTSHRGTLALSLYSFPGAEKPLGVASGDRLELNLGKGNVITVRSTTEIVPFGAKYFVYGFFKPEKKSESSKSDHLHETTSEKEMLERLSKL